MSQPQRYKLTIAYRGTNYHGWQQQAAAPNWKGDQPLAGQGIPTVQEMLKRAIVDVVKHPVVVCGSSRTDAGVHAKGQVAHFDTTAVQIPPLGLWRAVNARLPADIVVRSLEPVDAEFNAIGSTISKRYQYLIWHGPQRNVFMDGLAWHRSTPMNLLAMKQAAAVLVGQHDFASFAKTGHGRESTVRTVLGCDVSQRGAHVVIGIEATGFLWNMVRIIVGTLVEVGIGRYGPQRVEQMLQARDRQAGGPTAPPQGLYLQWIRHQH